MTQDMENSRCPHTMPLGWVLCLSLSVNHTAPTPTFLDRTLKVPSQIFLHFWVVASVPSFHRWAFLFGCSTQCWNLMSPVPSYLLSCSSSYHPITSVAMFGFPSLPSGLFSGPLGFFVFLVGTFVCIFPSWYRLCHTLWLTSTGASEEVTVETPILITPLCQAKARDSPPVSL